MADDDRTLRVRLLADIGNYVDGLKKAATSTREFGREVSGRGDAVKADIEKVGHTALLMSAGVAAGLALSAKAAIDWESAWAGVTKTVDGTASQMADLEDGLRNLASELPATHQEIAAVAEAAGALGIERGAIESFTRTMIDLGETTDLTADQAANAIARIANVMQTPQANIDRLGSTLVALGNDGASTESEILELANRLAAAGEIAGLTEADVLAFGSTLSSVGIEAEAGGSAMSKVFTSVSDAVKDGGDKLTIFGRVAGLTAEQFKAAYEKDAAGAISSFVGGLGEMIDRGESLTPVLESLEFTDIRLANALKSTATAGELLNEQLDLGGRAWEENTALATEAEKRYDTFAAKADIARNELNDLGIDVGQVLLPALSEVLDVGSNVVRGLGELDGVAGTAATGLGGLAAAGLGAIGIIGTFGPKVREFHKSLESMGSAGNFLAANLGRATLALGAVGVAVGVYSYILGKNAEQAAETETKVRNYTDAIREQGSAVGELTDQLALKDILEGEIGEAVRTAGADLTVFTAALADSGDKIAKLDDNLTGLGALDEMGDLVTVLDEAGLSGSALAEELLRLQLSGELTDSQMNTLVTRLADSAEQHANAAREAENLSAAETAAGDSAEDAARGQRHLGEDLGLTTEEADAAEQSIRDLIDAYRASVDPLFGMLDALDRNREAQRAQADAAAEGAERVKDAQEGVKDAQEELTRARKDGDEDGIRAATDRLADAQENLTEVQKDAAISADEKAKFDRDAAQSALDVEVAARNLALEIEKQPELLEAAKGMLAEWVDQGLITEDQAKKVAKQFEDAATKAGDFAGDWVATAYVNTEPALKALGELDAVLANLTAKYGTDLGTQLTALQALSTPGGGGNLATPGGATGGIVGQLGAPGPSDTALTWLTPGEGIVNLQGMSMLGPSGLDAINAGRLDGFGTGAMTDSRSYDQSVTWAPQIMLPAGSDAREFAGSTLFALRTMAAQAG